MAEVYQRMAEKIPNMSRAQEKIAKYILSNPNSTPFLTVEKLAKLSGVSIATVTRFVIFLGYKGYPEFLKDTQQSMQQQVSKNERLKNDSNENSDDEKEVYDIFEEDLNNIKLTMEELDLYELKKAVNLLLNAKKIYIVARRSASVLGSFLKYYLDFMFNSVNLIENIEQIPKQINGFSGEEVIIGISFEKYARSTVEIVAHLKSRGVATIAITDNMLSPLVPYSDVTLTAMSKGSTEIESFAAPISLINALITSIEKERKDCFTSNVELLEEAWRKFDLFI
ncbi:MULTISPECIES: MurR/RpiR family transcriptional regulator [Clostridium]|jgi:DNA-binding MurR/RpiR family transcriptional regulator|uniref:Transcriptional regulator, RpiR family n=1 Tax=Clostridium saccharoperbutylacetonicum N1-4(HMT) TaxID=931276 RepID=M1MER4_9CLOT|nr:MULTISPECIES: MurR/RpiR family transcriptional regulator [Clostridium]AGF56409.1 transcriptional regulator, RpiR family [Clostridium saccharoperbutylacetonicum N1-4(HMT)]AQR95150.1 putative HTH-type transcriptional regulator YbbH [Clostridium saccharoperbutylacetonicum]NRT62847.1 DNA-binding MurR/RpiR family transcriptional regulator [Clostridium saccharoperbutylacetonicum]NSB26202.1 DNA-binding MurR/RpiR family transcriptional regulator [Clostridium saccharoperbutylacetonicum]NSB30997.1 DN